MARIPLKYLPIAGILVLLSIIGYFIVKAGYKGGNNSELNESPPETGLTIKNTHSNQENLDNGTSFVLEADEWTYSQDEKQVIGNNFWLHIKPLDGPSWEVKGSKADYDTKAKVIRLSGNLQGHSDDGYGIFTEYLIYDYEKKESVLKTDEPVKITGPFFSMSGKGLLYYPEKEKLKIISDVIILPKQGN